MPRVQVDIHWTGMEEVRKLIMRSFMGDFKTQKKVFLKAMWVGAQPVVKAAKANYNMGGSGALASATKAYQWRNNTPLKRGIRVGPKRSSTVALRKWITHYRRKIGPEVFNYGIRHAHLVEYGFHHVRSKRNIPGKFPLTRAVNSAQSMIAPKIHSVIQSVIRKETQRIMKRARRRKAR